MSSYKPLWSGTYWLLPLVVVIAYELLIMYECAYYV